MNISERSTSLIHKVEKLNLNWALVQLWERVRRSIPSMQCIYLQKRRGIFPRSDGRGNWGGEGKRGEGNSDRWFSCKGNHPMPPATPRRRIRGNPRRCTSPPCVHPATLRMLSTPRAKPLRIQPPNGYPLTICLQMSSQLS